MKVATVAKLLGLLLLAYFIPHIGIPIILWKLFLQGYKYLYFNGEEFNKHKKETKDIVSDYNDLANYIKEISNKNFFTSIKPNHKNSKLAKYENTSKNNYNRDKNTRTAGDNVHSASLSVVKKASQEPIKYLCKYFNIDANEDNMKIIESIGENLSRLENAVVNIRKREENIKSDFKAPWIIRKFFYDEFLNELGMDVPKIEIEYQEYLFEYISSGGNSSQRTRIILNEKTIEALLVFLSEKIKYKKSAKAQRTLMTKKLREEIKTRDSHTCQICGASTREQDLLLLEVDHIIPVSKGGLSTKENLQTLCWKCNRTKSDKII